MRTEKYIEGKRKDCIREKKDVECIIKDEVYMERFTKDEKDEFVGQVAYYLTATGKACGKEAKAQIALKLFQYLSSPKSVRFMKDNKKFGTTVLNKLNEMQSDFKYIPKYNTQFQFVNETINRRMK